MSIGLRLGRGRGRVDGSRKWEGVGVGLTGLC